jgi:TFIIF-interacting CTD phosphatase-like protein
MYFPFYFGNEFLLVKTNGMYRDMSYLNRDPKKTVIIDFEKDSYLNAKDNIIKMSHYEGQKDDQEIKKLLFFLNHLAKAEIKDVRKEIS